MFPLTSLDDPQQPIVPDNIGRSEPCSVFRLTSLDGPSQVHNRPTSKSTTVHSNVGDTADMRRGSGQLPSLSLEGGLGGSGSPPSSREVNEICKQYMRMPASPPPSSKWDSIEWDLKEWDLKEWGLKEWNLKEWDLKEWNLKVWNLKEWDSIELKKVWKPYIPASGSGSRGKITPNGRSENGNVSKIANAPGPGPKYRRSRVASLPTVKTPALKRDKDHLKVRFADTVTMYQSLLQPSTSTLTSKPGEVVVGMGTDNTEDLRSYEAAVMARIAPATLNLKVRRQIRGKGKERVVPTSVTGDRLRDERRASASSGNSSHLPPGGDSPTWSNFSKSSSLANAFGASRPLPSHSRAKALVGIPLKSSATVGRLPFAAAGGGKDSIKKESSSPSLSSPASSLFCRF